MCDWQGLEFFCQLAPVKARPGEIARSPAWGKTVLTPWKLALERPGGMQRKHFSQRSFRDVIAKGSLERASVSSAALNLVNLKNTETHAGIPRLYIYPADVKVSLQVIMIAGRNTELRAACAPTVRFGERRLVRSIHCNQALSYDIYLYAVISHQCVIHAESCNVVILGHEKKASSRKNPPLQSLSVKLSPPVFRHCGVFPGEACKAIEARQCADEQSTFCAIAASPSLYLFTGLRRNAPHP